MGSLIHQRCVVHVQREAAARCPECARFYCRECVTEHLGKMMCAHCVALALAEPATQRNSLVRWGAMAVVGLFFAWLLFYYLGLGLARIPDSFHGSAW